MGRLVEINFDLDALEEGIFPFSLVALDREAV